MQLIFFFNDVMGKLKLNAFLVGNIHLPVGYRPLKNNLKATISLKWPSIGISRGFSTFQG